MKAQFLFVKLAKNLLLCISRYPNDLPSDGGLANLQTLDHPLKVCHCLIPNCVRRRSLCRYNQWNAIQVKF